MKSAEDLSPLHRGPNRSRGFYPLAGVIGVTFLLQPDWYQIQRHQPGWQTRKRTAEFLGPIRMSHALWKVGEEASSERIAAAAGEVLTE
jgi:hypothetical protein